MPRAAWRRAPLQGRADRNPGVGFAESSSFWGRAVWGPRMPRPLAARGASVKLTAGAELASVVLLIRMWKCWVL